MENKMEQENRDLLRLRFEEGKKRLQEERGNRIKEIWNNLPKFETPEDVPEIPTTNPEEHKNFYVPRLIKAGAIPKAELVDGQCYLGEHRRAKIAKWKAQENVFEYWRHKFNCVYKDECNHFEDDDGFALFVPIKLATREEFEATK